MSIQSNRGFTLVEALVALAIMATIVFMALNYNSVNARSTNLSRYIGTKNRVLSTIRESAGMPATLRASMMAAVGGAAVNPQLLACAGGNPPNSCTSGAVTGLTMFSPIIGRDPSGNIVGVQAISKPPGDPAPMRVDSFGSPCTVAGPDCALLISTTMTPQCGPAVQPATLPVPANTELLPMVKCTFADVIEVTYTVQLDPNLPPDPALSSFINSVSGSVTVPVFSISGNVSK